MVALITSSKAVLIQSESYSKNGTLTERLIALFVEISPVNFNPFYRVYWIIF